MAEAAPSDPPKAQPGGDPGAQTRTAMAAERTWLAWWRTALAATAASLAIGRLAPELLEVARGPYVVLGIGFAALAIGLLVTGAVRHRQLAEAARRGEQSPLDFRLVAAFTVGGVLLALTTIVLVAAHA